MSGSEDAWLLEGVIGFLKGPIWNTPIQQFLEQNCYSKHEHSMIFINVA